ncbi:thiol-activated cytolysin family protein [Clostridiaceae bacterium M8S5]|nr:thiol-activated cytolysin family protein [Clostridiaceae bacterium M8S5]
MKLSKMNKLIVGLALSVCLSVQPALASNEALTQSKTNSIDKGIANLDYNKYEVLANQGDVIENVVPKEGYKEDGKFIVLEHTKKSLGTNPVDISVVDSIMDRTYPGALLLADGDFAKNRPTALTAKRKPIDISIDLPGLGKNNTITVDNPSYGGVTAAVNELIDKWSKKDSETHTLPARTQYSETMVYSKNQLKMGLNVDIDVADQLLGINFEAITKGEQKYMVASYKQIFYTVSAQLPDNPSDLFDESVTFKHLQGKGVSDQSPPVMVSNVAYGRTVYVVLKTNSQSNKVEAAFKALIKGQKIEANSEYENIINDSSFQVVVLGGDAQEHNKLITTNFEEIRQIIKDNATFSLKNPGYPISYTSTFIKDNALAAVHNSTDYVETTATEYSKGRIVLDHSGGYVARFNVSWDEVSYDDQGNEVLTHKVWDGNDHDRTAHYSSIINLPPNTKNINIFAKECTGLAWEWWRTVVDEKNVPLAGEIKVAIWGTTLFPASSIEFK